MLSAVIAWWALRSEARADRRKAFQHLAVVAQALYTGSTAAYTLTPDLPRSSNSSEVTWHK